MLHGALKHSIRLVDVDLLLGAKNNNKPMAHLAEAMVCSSSPVLGSILWLCVVTLIWTDPISPTHVSSIGAKHTLSSAHPEPLLVDAKAPPAPPQPKLNTAYRLNHKW
jgi:hypothetical protein